MKIFFSLAKAFIIFSIIILNENNAQANSLNEGIAFFEKKEFEKSKIFFERDLVFNPKSEKSYLYLAKIFNKKKNDEEEEINLHNVLLINPKNDEAIYMMAILKIKQSDYEEAKNLIERFDSVCKIFCLKKEELKEKFSKLTP